MGLFCFIKLFSCLFSKLNYLCGMKCLQKKFKVRIKHFGRQYYVIEYAYYRIFPIFTPLQKFFDSCIDMDLDRYSEFIAPYIEAERIALSIKSIQDIYEWNKEQEEKKIDFEKRKEEYTKEINPYKTKYL